MSRRKSVSVRVRPVGEFGGVDPLFLPHTEVGRHDSTVFLAAKHELPTSYLRYLTTLHTSYITSSLLHT